MRDARFKIDVVRLLRLAAVLTLLFSVLTGLGFPHRYAELFSHFRLQYFFLSLVLSIVFLFLGNRLYLVSLALLTLFNASFLLDWYLPTQRDFQSQQQLELMHINVHARSTAYQRLLDTVSSEDPDIVFLQEVDADWAENTKILLRDYPHAYVQPRIGNFGIAVYSKIPFDDVRHIDSPPFGYPTIIAELTINERPLTFVSSHPTNPIGHALYEARNEQLESLAAEVAAVTGDVVLLGDFNTAMWGPQFHALQEETGLKNARQGFGVLPTWPTFFPPAMIPIDHVLVSENIGIANFRTGQRVGSDHLPLVVTLSL